MAAARYVALNPVRARLAARAQDWAWSSARAHAAGRDDRLVTVKPLLDRVGRGTDLIGIDGEPGARPAARGGNDRPSAWRRCIYRGTRTPPRPRVAAAQARPRAPRGNAGDAA